MSGSLRLGQQDISVQVMRRDWAPPLPGSAEPRHTYRPILTTRAKVQTMAGTRDFAGVTVNGKAVSHVFTIRYTTVLFDVRDRLRDASGRLYQILSVSNTDLENKVTRIHCSDQGDERLEAAR